MLSSFLFLSKGDFRQGLNLHTCLRRSMYFGASESPDGSMKLLMNSQKRSAMVLSFVRVPKIYVLSSIASSSPTCSKAGSMRKFQFHRQRGTSAFQVMIIHTKESSGLNVLIK